MIADAPKDLPHAPGRARARETAVGAGSVEVFAPGHSRRAEAEDFIEAAYARTFGSQIRRHYPILIGVSGAGGAIQAAAGLRFADQGPLFLEQYLDEPVEVALARTFGVPTDRAAVAEIGNLAADDHRASAGLFMHLAAYLLRQGRTLAVATATRQLRRRFRRIGLTTEPLAPARPERLGSDAKEWGRYYGRDPEVLAGVVRATPPAFLLAPWAGRAEIVQ
jgi:hypothetical protein